MKSYAFRKRKREEVADLQRFFIPYVLVKSPQFSSLSPGAIILYGVMNDRVNLSFVNEWYDENGDVFIICSIEHIAGYRYRKDDPDAYMNQIDEKTGKKNEPLMNTSPTSAKKWLKELEAAGLIIRRRKGQGNPDWIYVMVPVEEQEEQEKGDFKEPCLFRETETVSQERHQKNTRNLSRQRDRNCLSRETKSVSLEEQKLSPNLTEYNLTKYNHHHTTTPIYNNIGDDDDEENPFSVQIKAEELRREYPQYKKIVSQIISAMKMVSMSTGDYMIQESPVSAEELQKAYMQLDKKKIKQLFSVYNRTGVPSISSPTAYFVTTLYNLSQQSGKKNTAHNFTERNYDEEQLKKLQVRLSLDHL